MSAAELDELYREARALVHPALHEGFGLTPLEAMARGLPVLAVSNAGTHEVCGDAALLVEPADLAAGLHRIPAIATSGPASPNGAGSGQGPSPGRAAHVSHESAYTLARGGASSGPGAGTP